MSREQELIRELAAALKIREVWFASRDDEPPICLDCKLHDVKYNGYGWTYKHAPNCQVRLLLEKAEDIAKESAA